MKRHVIGLVVVAAAMILVAGCSVLDNPTETGPAGSGPLSAAANGIDIPFNSVSAPLIAGRTEDIGVVRCWIEGDRLFIHYSTDIGWKLAETQVTAAASVADIDRTKNGAPKIGHFRWKREHEPPVGQYLYSIPLDELGFDPSGEFIIAAHADVYRYSDEGQLEGEEGAWALGERFVGIPVEYDDMIEKPAIAKGDDGSDVLLTQLEDSGNWSMYFTVVGWEITVRQLLINEVFFCGSDYSSFYFYDQFVELYNASDDTLYLDGCILTRNYPSNLEDLETIDYVRATYAFQFPGVPVTGREYPILPGQHVVVASDAIDHSLYSGNGVDLSGADWEFYNQLGSDYDNPDVPNLLSIHPTSTVDYMINLAHNAVVLATGEEYREEIYYTGSGAERVRIAIPLRTVLDGVEYSYSADVTKELTIRLDGGFAGIGCAKYSAQSVERIVSGLDTNDSTVDFHIIGPPTPGW